MLQIVREEISRVVYFDFQSNNNSSLQNSNWRWKTLEIANLGQVEMVKFEGSVEWIMEWATHLNKLGIF